MSPPDSGAAHEPHAVREDGGVERDPAQEGEQLLELRFSELMRVRQTSELPLPVAGGHTLPLGELDPEVLERLAAEMIKRRPNLGAHFYGRRGQSQHGLDILERETVDFNSVYQVRRYETLTPDLIAAAVSEYADPKPPKKGGPKPPRRFAARRYVLFTSALAENEKALQDRLEELQKQYSGDMVIEVWGREMVSGLLRECGSMVNAVFGAEWARVFCGFAPPPPDPADPDRLGLVENPVQVLNLDALVSDAEAKRDDDPLESARLDGVIAETLGEANFPAHAAEYRRRQAGRLQVAGDTAGAFALLWELAVAHFQAGAATRLVTVYYDLGQLGTGLDRLQAAKLKVLTAAQDWYEHGSQLAIVVPALEDLVAAADPDAALLACVTLEQALVDGWFDCDPPQPLMTPSESTPDLPDGLRSCAEGRSCADVVIRARLACVLADTRLTADSTPADADNAYRDLLLGAGAGRYLHAGDLVYARAAHAFAMHGDTRHAINLWRQAIMLSSDSRRYGDVLACRRALNAAILEQPVPAFSELDATSSLPNDARLLAASQPAELNALRAVHAGKLPDALSVSRRCLWESRLSGQLIGEREALELFGDVMLAAQRPAAALTAWVMAGTAGKAANLAGGLTEPTDMSRWTRSPVRAQQAAAAQVIGVQARLYGSAGAGPAVQQLLGLTADLWTSPNIQPYPAYDAIKALSQFGRNLPADAVDPVLSLLDQRITAGGVLTPETAYLLIQLYWAVPARRSDVAAIIAGQLAPADPPPLLWELVAEVPEQAREPLHPGVSSLADAGNTEALLTLARWRQPTPAVQLAARRTCANLLRQPLPSTSTGVWPQTTRFRDAATMVVVLTAAATAIETDPHDLCPGAGPLVTEKILLSMVITEGAPPPTPAPSASAAEPAHGEVSPAEAPPGQTRDHLASRRPDESADAAGGANDAREPDAQALTAAGPASALADEVALYLLAIAESGYPPAFYRAEALSALHSFVSQLNPGLTRQLATRLLALAENPNLNEYDQAELASQDPLSRGRLNIGAKDLATQALVMAADAAAFASAGEPATSLTGPDMRRLVTHAANLIRSADKETSKRGAIALALASRCEASLAHYGAVIAVHPDEEVRAVAASTAALGDASQRNLAIDPSPKVRAALARRTTELADDVIATLRADENVQVRQELASAGLLDPPGTIMPDSDS